MKTIFTIAAGVALIFAIAPEFSRYRAEHRLYHATALFRALLADRVGLNREAIFNTALSSATEASASLKGDSRPLILAGSLLLYAHRPADALVFYRRALSVGERAEIDLNLGRAYEMLDDGASASAAILRAAWINPAIVAALPENVQTAVQAVVAQNEALLREDRLAAPPPLPSQDAVWVH